MRKEAYYFPHDCNARNDERILAIRMRHGVEGYGIYFMIIERLRESSDYMSVKDYNVIAFDFRVGADKIKSIIEDFGLFQFTEDGKLFYSESLLERMKPLDNLRSQRQEAGKKSAEKRANEQNGNEVTTPVQRSLKKGATVVDKKSNKEKKSKEEKKILEEKEEEKKNDDEQQVALPSSDFLIFQKWIKENAPNVAKMKEPFTEAEFERLRTDFSGDFTKNLLLEMHNYKLLTTKNVSANLTFRKWSKSEGRIQQHGNQQTATLSARDERARKLAEFIASNQGEQ